MSIFDKLKHAFAPVEHAVEHFHAGDAAHAIENALINPVRKRIPGHLSFHEAHDAIMVARPDLIKIDVFAGFGIELGVELELEFGMGIAVRDPFKKYEPIRKMIEDPPPTVHNLCDRLWAIVPEEVHVWEELQAVVGEHGEFVWIGEGVMERVVEYIGHRGWLEKRLRP